MLHTLLINLKDLFRVLLMLEVLTVTLRFMATGKIFGKHMVLRIAYKILALLSKYSARAFSKGYKKLHFYLENKRGKEQQEATPQNVVYF